MSENTPVGGTHAAARPPREGRSNGQWKVDGTEPLNENEQWKQQDGGLFVAGEIAGLGVAADDELLLLQRLGDGLGVLCGSGGGRHAGLFLCRV